MATFSRQRWRRGLRRVQQGSTRRRPCGDAVRRSWSRVWQVLSLRSRRGRRRRQSLGEAADQGGDLGLPRSGGASRHEGADRSQPAALDPPQAQDCLFRLARLARRRCGLRVSPVSGRNADRYDDTQTGKARHLRLQRDAYDRSRGARRGWSCLGTSRVDIPHGSMHRQARRSPCALGAGRALGLGRRHDGRHAHMEGVPGQQGALRLRRLQPWQARREACNSGVHDPRPCLRQVLSLRSRRGRRRRQSLGEAADQGVYATVRRVGFAPGLDASYLGSSVTAVSVPVATSAGLGAYVGRSSAREAGQPPDDRSDPDRDLDSLVGCE
jgi:hypothetical protein